MVVPCSSLLLMHEVVLETGIVNLKSLDWKLESHSERGCVSDIFITVIVKPDLL